MDCGEAVGGGRAEGEEAGAYWTLVRAYDAYSYRASFSGQSPEEAAKSTRWERTKARFTGIFDVRCYYVHSYCC